MRQNGALCHWETGRVSAGLAAAVMGMSLGDFGVTALVAAALFTALLLFSVAGSRSRAADAPVALRRPDARASSPLDPYVLAREAYAGRVDLRDVGAPEFGAAVARTRSACASIRKRATDIAAAAALLIVAGPAMLAIVVAVRADSPGPALYRQRRIGLNGREFNILKFRSMNENAEKDGARWAETNDPRVTRVGRFLRRTRLDELPQAFNVLLGEMSFVGPRPERPEFVRLLEREIPNYHLRHVVRPGITGWAQVKHVYGASVEDARVKLQYDLYYIRHFSLMRDFLIMLMTVRVALLGLGAR